MGALFRERAERVVFDFGRFGAFEGRIEVALHHVHERVLEEVDLLVGADEKIRERREPVILRGRETPERGDGEVD